MTSSDAWDIVVLGSGSAELAAYNAERRDRRTID
jgi:hypothetical protein